MKIATISTPGLRKARIRRERQHGRRAILRRRSGDVDVALVAMEAALELGRRAGHQVVAGARDHAEPHLGGRRAGLGAHRVRADRRLHRRPRRPPQDPQHPRPLLAVLRGLRGRDVAARVVVARRRRRVVRYGGVEFLGGGGERAVAGGGAEVVVRYGGGLVRRRVIGARRRRQRRPVGFAEAQQRDGQLGVRRHALEQRVAQLQQLLPPRERPVQP